MADEQGRVVIVDGSGKRHMFPAGFDPKRAASIVKQQANPREPGLATIGDQVQSKWSDRMGLNEPTDSMVGGFFRGAGAAAVDMAQGATAEASKRLRENEGMQIFDPRQNPRMPQMAERQPSEPLTVPDTMAGSIGSFAPMAAELAMPGVAAKGAVGLLPSTARAGQKFQSVMGAAKNVPIDAKGPGDVALRIMELAERGGSMPKAVRDFLRLTTDPSKPGMTYEVARDLASNISRLSSNELGRLTPVMAREVAQLRVALNKSVADAAKRAGKADEYASAMREYAQAMRVRSIVDAAITGVKKAAPYATLAGGSYWLSKKLGAVIDQ